MNARCIPAALAAALVLAPSCGQPPPVDEPPPPPAADAGAPAREDAPAAIVEAPDAPPPEAQAPEQDPGPATITLAAGSKQGTITFGHGEHEGRLECTTCHHEMEDPQGAAQACRACHNPQATDTFDAKKAFHLQCLGCHKQEAGGPTKCVGCHVK